MSKKKGATEDSQPPKTSKEFKISYPKDRVVEEDEIAEISEIFNHFDFGNRGRVATTDLPTILRLLQHNIGEDEDKALRYEVDKKNRGYFTLKELVNLLNHVSFHEDTQSGLLAALCELDTDADGFIEVDVLKGYLNSVGEPLTDEEMLQFTKLARDDTSDRPTLIDIKRLAEIMLPKIVAENAMTKGMTKPQEAAVVAEVIVAAEIIAVEEKVEVE